MFHKNCGKEGRGTCPSVPWNPVSRILPYCKDVSFRYVCEVEQFEFDTKKSIQCVNELKYRDHNFTFDFTITGVDARSFPFETFRKLTSEVLRIENQQVLMLGHPQGEYEFRKTITNYLYESRGVQCSPSQIILGSGTQSLTKLLFQLLSGNIFAVENPGYHQKLVSFEKEIDEVKRIPLDRDGIIIQELEESDSNVVFVSPSHQFPCGMIMPISRRMQLLKWAAKKEGKKTTTIVSFVIQESRFQHFKG